jgi:hypothetical protein
MGFDDLTSDGKAEPSTLSFRREERIENAGANLL